MKPLLFVFALIAVSPLFAGLGFQEVGGLSVAALRGCGGDPIAGHLIAPPRCLFVSVRTDHTEATRFLITLTYEDAEGQPQFQWRSINREESYTTVAFDDLLGATLKTVEIEQYRDDASVEWTQFLLD
jgi:hypothetical protein